MSITRRAATAVAVGTLAATLGVAGTATAGEPANQACIGDLFKWNGEFGARGNGVGTIVSDFAVNKTFGSFGQAINAVQTGTVPDEVFPNTCND